MDDKFIGKILAQIDDIHKQLDGLRKMVEMLQRRSLGVEIRKKAVEAIESAPAAAEEIILKPRNKIGVLEEYNALGEKTGFARSKAIKDFIQRYRVRSFSCANSEARVFEPVPPPQFCEAESGDYWAIPAADKYAVVPNVSIRTYTENHHSARAMGVVFESNFQTGGDYRKIYVEKPAVFSCSGNIWTLVGKGRLILE